MSTTRLERLDAGTVCLVGAGPGAADLLTLRAVRCIEQADVLVYDRLVSRSVVDLAKPECERIFAGKRKHLHVMSQSRINDLLVQRARAGRRVVRLKGGDGLTFGRGGEEIDALSAAGVPWSVVPGVTAAQGAAAALGMPLTHREEAQACSFVTAHRRHGGLELDWDLVLRPNQTVAFYMGLSLLPRIVEALLVRGKPPETPFTVISRATCPEERWVSARLDEIVFEAARASLESPALLIMGPRPRRAAAVTPDLRTAPAAAACRGSSGRSRRSCA